MYKNHSVVFANKIVSNSYAHISMRKDTPQWNNSSAVLRHSHSKYTIPKDKRFKDPHVDYYNHYQIKYLSTLGNRGASIGIGNKVEIPKVFSNKKE